LELGRRVVRLWVVDCVRWLAQSRTCANVFRTRWRLQHG